MDYIKSAKTSHLTAAAAGLLAVTIASTMGFFSKNQMPVEGKTVLVTGGSEGMGLSVACQLAAKGANIVIISRSAEKLEKALKQVSAAAKSPSQRFHSIPCDVSQPDYAPSVVSQVTEWNNGQAPDIVWCVAGTSTPMLFHDDRVMPEMRREMDINFFGSSEMAHAVLRAWWSPANRFPADQPKHLIFTSSVLALYGVVGYTTYNPSKWALRGLADTLTQEALLYPDQPVKIHVVMPGTILSPGFEHEQRVKPEITIQLEKDDPQQTPDEVARKSIAGLEAGQYYVTVALLGHLMRWGSLGSAARNNALVDTIMMWIMTPIWLIVQAVLNGDIKKFAKTKGHPSTYPRKE
ncbi:NAD(P)-binding protein [Cryphonectria parasitica EP155]|uniref:3-dehydrosphinganine reductase n=1 Tax=Cryphonectria parasitica (strain ATCC 38755 / EP155) TaxID=660469 RepID=A0A9P4YAX7_CRYP1|nr:NAD(P)-binding protein [Cryphonectria parasitica EP155]KAF3770167.1 NAD(P)-binding protein [Cryphonectria parasitica EP155]